jgi:acetyl esterase/lipase
VRSLSISVLLVLFLFGSASGVDLKQLAQAKPTNKPVYKTIGETQLRLHVFEPTEETTDDSRPGIVFFFGGGWVGGSPKQFYTHCAYLASRGIWAAAAEYRVRKRHGTAPSACVEDGKSAIRWVREHAEALGVDATRLAAGGGSAGGHVATATATVSGFNADQDDQTISCVPDALVLFNPVYDNGPNGYGYDRVKDYWRQISPMHNLHADMPPAIVFLGTNDHLIPVKTAREFQKRMQTLGVQSELRLYEGAGHGFFNFNNANHRYFRRTVVEADRFLQSLGWLEGKATLTNP